MLWNIWCFSIIDVWHASEFASDHNTVTFSNQNSVQKLFFLRYTIKRKIWVIQIAHIIFGANTFVILVEYCSIKLWSSFKLTQTYLLDIISQILVFKNYGFMYIINNNKLWTSIQVNFKAFYEFTWCSFIWITRLIKSS